MLYYNQFFAHCRLNYSIMDVGGQVRMTFNNYNIFTIFLNIYKYIYNNIIKYV